jgi:competence protein ComFA
MRFATINGILIPQKEDSLPISKITTIPSQPPIIPDFQYNSELQKLLTGKQLLHDDLPQSKQEIHAHYQNGYITYRKGIDYNGKKPSCARCGNKDPQWFAAFPCQRCGETCLYCRQCIMMGRISECTPLIGWSGPNPSISMPQKIMEWQGKLSKGQEDASNRVVEAIQQNKELLVWAV